MSREFYTVSSGDCKIRFDSLNTFLRKFNQEYNTIILKPDLIDRMRSLKNLLEVIDIASGYTVFDSDDSDYDGFNDDEEDSAKFRYFKKIKDKVKEVLNQSDPAEQSPDLLKHALEILGMHRDAFGFGNTNSLSDISIQNFVLRYINDKRFEFDKCIKLLGHVRDRVQLRTCIETLAGKISCNHEALKKFIMGSPVVKGRWFEPSMEKELLQLVESSRHPTPAELDDEKTVEIVDGQVWSPAFFIEKQENLASIEKLKKYATIFCDWAKALFPEKYRENRIDDLSSDSIARVEKLKSVLTIEEKEAVKQKVKMHYCKEIHGGNTNNLQDACALLSAVQIPTGAVVQESDEPKKTSCFA